MWGLRAPTRCIIDPQGARKRRNEGGRLKANCGPKETGQVTGASFPQSSEPVDEPLRRKA